MVLGIICLATVDWEHQMMAVKIKSHPSEISPEFGKLVMK